MNNLGSQSCCNRQGSESRPNWLAAVLWRNPRLLARCLQLTRILRIVEWCNSPARLPEQVPRPHVRLLSRASLPRAAAKTACSLGAAALMLAPLGPRPATATGSRATTDILVADGLVAAAPDGLCSLIEAIHNANDTNTGQPYPDCAAGDPGLVDMIVLPEGGDFSLSAADNTTYGPSGLPVITDFVTIQSPTTATIHRDPAAEPFRVLAVGRAGRLVLERVTISGGRTPEPGRATAVTYATVGGGALNLGALFLNDAVISGNVAFAGGGIYNGGNLYGGGEFIGNNAGLGGGDALLSFGKVHLLNSPRFVGNGDVYFGVAVENEGMMTLMGALFADNQSTVSLTNRGEVTVRESQFSGAPTAVTNDGRATIEDTLIGGNGTGFANSGTARIDRSAVVDNKWGLINHAGALTLVNSTISGNHSSGDGGGVLVDGGQVFGYFNTISDNSAKRGGGVFVSGHYTDFYYLCVAGFMTLSDSILSGNEADAGPEAYVEKEWIHCLGHLILDDSIVGHDGQAGTVNLFLHNATVPREPLAAIIDPALSTNDPTSPVHRLPWGSPAVDALLDDACGHPLVAEIDQRGQPRNVDGDGQLSEAECDVGAFERQPFSRAVFVPVVGAMEAVP